MFKIGICDDEPVICSMLEEIILDYSKLIVEKIDMEVFYSGEALYNYIKNENYFDLIFLDIELDKLDGIELGKIIREEMKNEMTQIVYISSKENYAMELFEVRPLNFLIKPINSDKIIRVVSKAIKLLDNFNHFFVYKQGCNSYRRKIKDIIYFESDNRKVKMVTTTDEIIFYGTLSEIYSQLEVYKFFFIHKSYLVNFNHIAESYYDKLVMSNSNILSISQPKRGIVRKILLKYEGDELK